MSDYLLTPKQIESICETFDTYRDECNQHGGVPKESLAEMLAAAEHQKHEETQYWQSKAEEAGWKSPEEIEHDLSQKVLELSYGSKALEYVLEQARQDERMKTLQEVGEIFTVYDKYTAAMSAELNEVVPLSMVHGWHTSRFEQGKTCREEIANLKIKYLGRRSDGQAETS